MRTVTLFALVAPLLGCKIIDDAREQITGETKKPAASAVPAVTASAAPGSAPGPAAQAGRPSGFSLMKFAVGQHVEYRMAGVKQVNRYAWAIVGKEGDAFWLQISVTAEGQDIALQMLTDIQDGSQIDGAKPKKMKLKIPGQGVREISGPMMAMANRMSDNTSFFLEMNPSTIATGAREDVSVPAGSFPGTFQWTGKTKWQGKTSATKFWSHPNVPITGIVKGHDGVNTWELASFGTSGAKSEF